MTFISYAQNMEDVMLYRALKNIHQGFYIDVGAGDPTIDSVAKAFYDMGWSGINIEPVEAYFRELQQKRPRDLNLNTLVGNFVGDLTFYEVIDTGLSTIKDAYANYHRSAGRLLKKRFAPCTTLDIICTENNVHVIHFLKIDVEGAEKEVLEGFAFETIRPWIVVAEIHDQTGYDVSTSWEYLLLEKHYKRVYYDGINYFFVALEHNDLADSFKVPPNLFDEFIIWRHANYGAEPVRRKLEDLESKLQHINDSLSWRMTAPLRKTWAVLISLAFILLRRSRQ